ncbi:MAG: FG-GAP-like repeat-containing protein [Saprospiraceae bacterium]|nr:FG-GAP-like repeat-containing protein [Saprospiraceae bacterium]
MIRWFPGFVIACLVLSCSKEKTQTLWISALPHLGAYASPRTCDLNNDGILDIVIGTGRNEFQPSDSAVIALNGATGEVLWHASATDQIVGSATFLDINSDGIKDVIIGGRGANLMALQGHNGAVIWRYQTQDTVVNSHGYARFNFYNTQIIPDQNGDGIPDLLAANGGNVHAPPHSDKLRYPGVLLVINSANGRVIAADIMPDGKETYMSPVIHDFDGDGNMSILFGTGGETVGGNLYMIDLQSFMAEDISSAELLIEGQDHGFIAPPTLADINGDRVHDIIINYHGGTTYAMDGVDHSILWSISFEGLESSSSVIPGYFNEDGTPDFFTYFCKGEWPDNTGLERIMIDGKTGKVLYRASADCGGIHSGISVDLNGDKIDEVIVNYNSFDCNQPQYQKIVHHLELIDFTRNSTEVLIPRIFSKSIASTPWIGYLANDGLLDIIFVRMTNTSALYDANGLQIERHAITTHSKAEPTWGSYMGSDYSGILSGK